MPACPQCQSNHTVKNGRIHNGKQRFKCKACGRQFIEHPTQKRVTPEQIALIDRLLLERLSQAAIARVAQVSESWIESYVAVQAGRIPRQAQVRPKKKGRLILQLDELWSFVGSKKQKVWIWLALDAGTREVVGMAMGDRSAQLAQKLWESLPGVYRQCAVCYTDFWEAYRTVIPRKRHRPVGKETGLTNYVERLNNTLRQRISRLVRKTLSFSKSLVNHEAAIWRFIHHYNASLPIVS